MDNIPEMFASCVFNDDVMRERLPRNIYESLHNTIDEGRDLDLTVANIVAEEMKNWAVSKGATHYTHWFQPMTGFPAQKHEAFIKPEGQSRVIMDFSGKELIRGESDASSFPSGGLRATFEARGYTAWDPTSYAFVREGSLYIPTVFCSYGGYALDSKTPLLRSMQDLNTQALRILRLFGNNDVKRVMTTTGLEQEYFLIDKEMYAKRKDLEFCGRTLFGAKPPKGQEIDDHYLGTIKPRVAAYMADLDKELWKLGIFAKTKHNEVAPSQHELAPVFTNTNTAVDHNLLIMEVMKSVADRHGFVCLLGEKPFNGVNGSGKHCNWSLTTDTGVNLLEPGLSPHENAQFLLFLTALIKAVDEYQDLVRVSVATASNDNRLGGNEAPPAIVSMYLGDDLTAIFEAAENGSEYCGSGGSVMEIGVHVLPSFPKDSTDRNRTSPFAFTGNKFEFRMPGSSQPMGDINTTLNLIVSEELEQFADELEGAEDFNTALNELIKKTYSQHKRIIWGGDGYSESWKKEAANRGLLHLRDCIDALPYMVSDKNVTLYEKHSILSGEEIKARYEIRLSTYRKQIKIEALTMLEMVKKSVIPAAVKYSAELAEAANKKLKFSPSLDVSVEKTLCERISSLANACYRTCTEIENCVSVTHELHVKGDALVTARYCRDNTVPLMKTLRGYVDELESIVDSSIWPFPTYSDLLFTEV